MSDQGEKTCPLCAEEMDLTDQQLKPCKCGYEICVWCWHHIMDMAEKDDTEGRCPACRAPYDKDKIVGMAANCERLVAEVNIEKRSKSQKVKTKSSSEGRKQLSSVRVIQRNLVYIVGLPLHLADEDLLQRRDFFGQYGKVLKVSMSRTSAGVIQQFPNNTCSVYITYSKEEEAIRCIQSVHGFVLEGRPLRVCFGTTKYCHAWLRNVPCTNPDCLYLHEIGSQEDSFTKDEIISAYTRSRVQQITGNANTLQRRSGNVLPPPLDDYSTNSSASMGKPIVKNAPNTTAGVVKGSPPNGSNGRSVTLPPAASWGTRASSLQSSASSSGCLSGPSMMKSESVERTYVTSPVVESTAQAPLFQGDNIVRKTPRDQEIQSLSMKSLSDPVNPLKQHSTITAPDGVLTGSAIDCHLSDTSASKDDNGRAKMHPNIKNSIEDTRLSCTLESETEKDSGNGDILNSCHDISSANIVSSSQHELLKVAGPKYSDPLLTGSVMNQGSQQQLHCEEYGDNGGNKALPPNFSVCVSTDYFDQNLHTQNQVANMSTEVEGDILTFDIQRCKDPEVARHSFYSSAPARLPLSSNQLRSHSLMPDEAFGMMSLNAETITGDNKMNGYNSLLASNSAVSNGYHDTFTGNSAESNGTSASSTAHRKDVKGTQTGKQCDSFVPCSNSALDTGESSIISNILSLDCDSWDGSLKSPHYLAKLLGDTDERTGSIKTLTSRKVSNNNQSMFSFARQEDSMDQAFDFEPPLSVPGQPSRSEVLHKDFENKGSFSYRTGLSNGFHPQNFGEADNFACNQYLMASSRSSVPRTQMLAPPGFSAPSKAPPPGFSTRERMDHSFDSMSRNHLHDSASWLCNAHQQPAAANIGNTVDIEFMDPAILAVGKGRQNGLNNLNFDFKNFPLQSSAFEGESRLQSLMQGSPSPQHNPTYISGDNYSLLGSAHGLPSRMLDRSQAGNMSSFSQSSLQRARNGLTTDAQWDGWSDIQGRDGLSITQLLRNDRLGLNRFYDGYEDSKLWMSSSGDLYNRSFGI